MLFSPRETRGVTGIAVCLVFVIGVVVFASAAAARIQMRAARPALPRARCTLISSQREKWTKRSWRPRARFRKRPRPTWNAHAKHDRMV